MEYVANHPYLVAATVVALIIAAVFELLQRGRNTGVSPAVVVRLHNQGAPIVDVRSAEEFAAGHIVEARNLPLAGLNSSLDTLKKYREKPVIVCCEQGSSSAQAAKLLKAQGFNNVATLKGGLAAWRQDNLPLVQAKQKVAKAG